LVEMLDGGAPGWESGGETVLVSAGWELWFDGAVGAAGIFDAR